MRVLPMKCKDVQKKLLDYSEGMIDQKTSAQIEAHLHSCAQCAQELKTFEETVRLLQRVPIKEPPEEFWNGFTRGVMQNVRRMERTTAPPLFGRFPCFQMGAVAVAAILLGVFGLFFLIKGDIFQKNPQQIAQQQTESYPPISELHQSLEKIVPPKMVENILREEWALTDGQELSAFDIEANDDDVIDYLLEDLTESEKQALVIELERMQ